MRPHTSRQHNKYGESDGIESTTHARSFFTAGYEQAVRKLYKDNHTVTMVANAIKSYNNLKAAQATKQYSVKEGIKVFGDAGVNAVLKEFK